jgi:hypothetical protein
LAPTDGDDVTAYDQYEEAREIAALLDQEGLKDQATQLRNALADGATGTEIFMMIRFRLKVMLNDGPLPHELSLRIKTLYSYLDTALH